MPSSQEKNKRIAKNTFALCARMFITAGISIYSSRVLLEALGVEDYGIQNVVGGVITMLSFLKTSMVSSTQRYINFAQGSGQPQQAVAYFHTSANLHILLSLLIVILGETAGLWFLNTRLTIPATRMLAANVIYQFTIVSAVASILSVPYQAVIICHERMRVYAYESVIRSVAMLVFALMLIRAQVDRLILYGVLTMLLGIGFRLFDGWYCRHYLHYTYRPSLHRQLAKQLLSFSVWTFLCDMGFFIYTQGSTFLINIFFGPVVNAAQALAATVNMELCTFGSNFMMAVKPQITQSYAAGALHYMERLFTCSMKLCWLIMCTVGFPFLLRADYVLNLWLKEVPDYTVEFLQMAILLSIATSIASPFTMAVQATGKIRNYHICEFIAIMTILPLTYAVFKAGAAPYHSYTARTVVLVAFLLVRFVFIKRLLGFSLRGLVFGVWLRCVVSSALAFVVLLLLNPLVPQTFLGLLLVCVASLALSAASGWGVALSGQDRMQIKGMIQQAVRRRKHS